MNNKELAIHLIGEDIRNKFLMFSLEELGFDCTSFTLNISGEILELVGFQDRTNEIYQHYFNLIEKALEDATYLNLDEVMGKCSLSIYNELLGMRLNENPKS